MSATGRFQPLCILRPRARSTWVHRLSTFLMRAAAVPEITLHPQLPNRTLYSALSSFFRGATVWQQRYSTTTKDQEHTLYSSQ